MKSDREFLDGIYVKAEGLASNPVLSHVFGLKENYNRSTLKHHAFSTKYAKYAGMAAGILLLISSALYINTYIEKNNQIDNQPMPSNIRMISYTDQLMEEATDIVEIRAKHENDVLTLSIIKSYKNSGNESKISSYLNNDVIGLTADQSAIVFIDADSENAPVVDIFLWEADSNIFINPYGEIITKEILDNSN